MILALKIVSGLFALLFLFMGVGFMFDPTSSAAGVGLNHVGELGLNTLRGDMGGMFLASAALIGLGVFLKRVEWLLAVAVLMLFIAAGRLVGFAVDGNPTQPTLMAFGFEIVIAAVLFATSRKLTGST